MMLRKISVLELRHCVSFYSISLPFECAAIAQLVEQLTCNEKVRSSILRGGTKRN